MPSEFELIARYFARSSPSALLGVGDDAALIQPRPDMSLAVSTDMLLEGRHFMAGTDPAKLGHKSLAVNLSDLAAMGADARWVLLGIALPEANEAWVASFAKGFFALADRYGVELIGGDTTRGCLAISVSIMGEVPPELALRRDGAMPGDDVWLSGATGEAAMALAHLQGRRVLPKEFLRQCLNRLELPEPRLELGGRLRGIARSAIDVSDGLVADLGHILKGSGVAAELRLAQLPLAPALAQCADGEFARDCLLAGGDDYELLFTAPPHLRNDIAALSAELSLPLTAIGMVLPRQGPGEDAQITVRDAAGRSVPVARRGYDHFS
jgi:thiamine-monophosphate kinase